MTTAAGGEEGRLSVLFNINVVSISTSSSSSSGGSGGGASSASQPTDSNLDTSALARRHGM